MKMYENCQIVNIRRGKGRRENIIYAQLRSADGELLMSATLDHIVSSLKLNLPFAPSNNGEKF